MTVAWTSCPCISWPQKHGQATKHYIKSPEPHSQPLDRQTAIRYPILQIDGRKTQSPLSKIAMNASWGISTLPTRFIRFLPSFCFSSSLRFRVMSPP